MARKSYNLPNHAHYLTFSCYKRQKLLTSDVLRERLVEIWVKACTEGDFAVWAYVIMPEHAHLLIYPRKEQYEVSKILRLLKERFARWVVRKWKDHSPHLLEQIVVIRGQRTLHRCWQEGGGYDKNVHEFNAISRIIEYIEFNPVRRGLVKDPLEWKWSSARLRAGEGNVEWDNDKSVL